MKPIRLLLLLLLMAGPAIAQQPIQLHHLKGNFYICVSYQLYNNQPYPANCLYALTPKGIILIDTPWGEDNTRALLDSLEARYHLPVLACLATHFHEDRTGGFDIMKEKGIPTWSSRKTLELCRQKSQPLAAFVFEKDTSFSLGGTRFQTFYPGHGHAPDNIVVWFGKEKILYGGCFVKSYETNSIGNLSDANLKTWPAALHRVIKKFPNPRFIIPGHEGWQKTTSLRHTLELIE